MRTQLQRSLVIILFVASSAVGQASQDPGPTKRSIVVDKVVTAGPVVGEGAGVFQFNGAEFLFEGKVVKGAPYSAQAVTELTQILGDGNRIVRKTTGSIARDSEGRTRREQSFEAVGPWSSGDDTPQVVFINDPVAGVKYVLETNSHKARKSISGDGPFPGAMRVRGQERELEAQLLKLNLEVRKKEGEERTESLGEQMIEGVQAEGTRTTRTIPAGQIGNERPIEIDSEVWYSPELKVVVMSRRNDPRLGETVYTLTHIDRSEPPPSLFEVPSDYTEVEEGASTVRVQELDRKMKARKRANE